jgi:hypothetical protein
MIEQIGAAQPRGAAAPADQPGGAAWEHAIRSLAPQPAGDSTTRQPGATARPLQAELQGIGAAERPSEPGAVEASDGALSTVERQGVSPNPYLVTAPGDTSLAPASFDTTVSRIVDQLQSGLAGKDPDAHVILTLTYDHGIRHEVDLGLVRDLKGSRLIGAVREAVKSADGEYAQEERVIAVQGSITLAEIAANASARPDTVKPSQATATLEFNRQAGERQLPRQTGPVPVVSAFSTKP